MERKGWKGGRLGVDSSDPGTGCRSRPQIGWSALGIQLLGIEEKYRVGELSAWAQKERRPASEGKEKAGSRVPRSCEILSSSLLSSSVGRKDSNPMDSP